MAEKILDLDADLDEAFLTAIDLLWMYGILIFLASAATALFGITIGMILRYKRHYTVIIF